MHRPQDQLQDEVTYRHLAAYLRSGGTLKVGGNITHGSFARIYKGNRAIFVPTNYRDFAAVLKEMDAKAREFMDQTSESTRNSE